MVAIRYEKVRKHRIERPVSRLPTRKPLSRSRLDLPRIGGEEATRSRPYRERVMEAYTIDLVKERRSLATAFTPGRMQLRKRPRRSPFATLQHFDMMPLSD